MVSKRKTKKRKKQENRSDEFGQLVGKLIKAGQLEGREVVYEPSGEEKMSEVIMGFVEPYLELVDTYEAQNKLIGLATLAWNAALLPKEEQGAMVGDVIGNLKLSDSNAKELVKLVETMMKRKRRYFSDNNRVILNYHLSETRHGFHLSVASSMTNKEENFN